MASPSSALARFARYYLVVGHKWLPFVDDDQDESAGDEQTVVRMDCAPLILLWTGESRSFTTANSYSIDGGSVGGGSYTVGPYGSPQLVRFSETVDGQTAYRWARVVNRPQAADTADVLDKVITGFEITGWSERLSEGGWGGASLTISLPDPGGLYHASGKFVEGASVSVYVEEYEDSALFSATELFSGFIRQPERVASPVSPRIEFTAVTIEALLDRASLSNKWLLFVDSQFDEAAEIAAGLSEVSGDTAGISGHHKTFDTLTVSYLLNHMLRWHLRASVNGADYDLLQLVDIRRDVWNDGDPSVYRLTHAAFGEGPLLGNLRGALGEGIWYAHASRYGLDITRAHEMKTTADSAVDSIDADTVYSLRYIDGPDNQTSQVWLIQTPASLTDLEDADPVVSKYPSSPDAQGSVRRISTPFWFGGQAAGDALAEGYYRRDNSQDRVLIVLAGAPFGIFNLLTLAGDTYVVEQVTHLPGDRRFLGGHVTEVLARKVDLP